WYLNFCQRLLEGSRPVLALVENNPFPEAPPRYVRGVVYRYHFTDATTRRASGAWWRREEGEPFGPVLTLVDGRLMALPGRGRPGTEPASISFFPASAPGSRLPVPEASCPGVFAQGRLASRAHDEPTRPRRRPP